MTIKTAEHPVRVDADWPDELLSASRPRVRRDILYTQVPEGVLFHDATTGFRIHGRTAYRFATLVVPFLDGRLTVAELSAGLGDSQRAMVLSLVRTLYRRRFARPVPAPDPGRAPVLSEQVRRRFEAQIAYVDHHVDGSQERFARFRATRVAIVGSDEIARWVTLSLLRNGVASIGVAPTVVQRYADTVAEADGLRGNGCPVELRTDPSLAGSPNWADLRGYDVVVVTPDDQATRVLVGLLEAGVPEGRTLLPAWQLGSCVAVGPSTAPAEGEAGCWVCAVLRLGSHGDAHAAADLWSGLVGHRAALARPTGPVAAMIGNLLGYEIFRLTTGALPAETVGQVVVQDIESLDVDVERLLPHPRCPLCASPRRTVDSGTSAEVPTASPQPERPIPEPGGPEAEQLLAALSDRTALVAPRLGVFARFDDDALPQTPLRVSTAEVALGHGRHRRIAAFDVHNVVGARLAALAAAAVVYAEHVVPPGVEVTGRTEAPALTPGELSTGSGIDPEARTITTWTSARSMSTGASVLVPTAAVAPHSRHNEHRPFAPGPAGIGVDDAPARARGAALLSALSHDALASAMRGRRPLVHVDLTRMSLDPVLTFLVRTAVNLSVEPELVELGSADELPAPVLLARCLDPRNGSWLWTVAADTSWRAAAVTTLRDLLGRVQLAEALHGEGVDTGDPLVADLAPQALKVSTQAAPRLDLVRSFPDALHRLRADGADAFVVDRGSADLAAGGLCVARVLIGRSADAG